jgi:hypothetical protein
VLVSGSTCESDGSIPSPVSCGCFGGVAQLAEARTKFQTIAQDSDKVRLVVSSPSFSPSKCGSNSCLRRLLPIFRRGGPMARRDGYSMSTGLNVYGRLTRTNILSV